MKAYVNQYTARRIEVLKLIRWKALHRGDVVTFYLICEELSRVLK